MTAVPHIVDLPLGARFATLCALVGGVAAALALPVAGLPGAVIALAVMAAVAVAGAPRLAAFHPHPRLGPANMVTLARAGVTALAAAALTLPGGLAGNPALAWALAAAVAAALALDGLDGWLARRTGLASRFGARLDMEVDAGTGAVLAALAWLAGKTGLPEALLLGGLRYAFVAASLRLPWLSRPLPDSFRRKTVCVLQIGVLALLLVPPLAPPVSALPAALAAGALAWSFAVDVRWLWRAR